MFFTKVCRIFHHKKSSKSKKVKSNEIHDVSIFQNAPPVFLNDGNQSQTPPKFTTQNRLFQAKNAEKDVDDEEENEFALSKPLPKFRNNATWRSSKPFAQNAMRYRFYPKRSHRFNASRSKNASHSVSKNPQC